ncbi:hypothetical protein JOF56_010128 [Kibdelosporangium banguiense]|uniref:Transposase of IS4/5 family n=1 Tax=Kibdelosporangium banguiense TaxID=1365924 RepID=A0ABS4TZA8_9PSEU|nr:hypothetical protein [Kibdelosporangium banguiense]
MIVENGQPGCCGGILVGRRIAVATVELAAGRKRRTTARCCATSCLCSTPAFGGSFLPQELAFGCGMTCWRRLRDWHEAGVWRRLHELLLAELHATGLVQGRSGAVIDSSHFRALKGGPKPDRARSTVP